MYENEYDERDEVQMPTPEFTLQMVKMLGIDVSEIKSAVIVGVQESIMKNIKKDVQEQVAKSVRDTVNETVNTWVKDFLEKPFTPVNSWGEPIGKEPTTIRSVIEEKSKDFMMERVDRNGKTDGYDRNEPRFIWAARQVAESAVRDSLRPELDKVIAEMKSSVVDGINGVVSDLVARNFRKQ